MNIKKSNSDTDQGAAMADNKFYSIPTALIMADNENEGTDSFSQEDNCSHSSKLPTSASDNNIMTEAAKGSAANAASAKREQAFRLFLLFMMTAQNSSVVLVSRYTRAGVSDEDLYVINDLVMVTEIAKVSWFGLFFIPSFSQLAVGRHAVLSLHVVGEAPLLAVFIFYFWIIFMVHVQIKGRND